MDSNNANVDKKVFDPLWRDDILDERAIAMPLFLPDDTFSKKDENIWVMSQFEVSELVFGKPYQYKTPQRKKAIVKRSYEPGNLQLKNMDNDTVVTDTKILDLILPPKAWMTDAAEERCAMYAAAQIASGDILVGGLGLGIYPQMVLLLERPINSITIIEKNRQIIGITRSAWLDFLGPTLREKIQIVEGSIETYLRDSQQCFDTIYLDTWEDADSRFLAHVNYLIRLAVNKVKAGGRIQCWGYTLMLDTFIKEVKIYEKFKMWMDLDTAHRLDPVLEAYIKWRKGQGKFVEIEAMEKQAFHVATSVVKVYEENERSSYFTPYYSGISGHVRFE